MSCCLLFYAVTALLTLVCELRECARNMSSTRPLMEAAPMSLLKNTCSRIVESTAPTDVSLINSWPNRLGACGLWRRIYSSKALRVLFWTACTCTASESCSISVEIIYYRFVPKFIAFLGKEIMEQLLNLRAKQNLVKSHFWSKMIVILKIRTKEIVQ